MCYPGPMPNLPHNLKKGDILQGHLGMSQVLEFLEVTRATPKTVAVRQLDLRFMQRGLAHGIAVPATGPGRFSDEQWVGDKRTTPRCRWAEGRQRLTGERDRTWECCVHVGGIYACPWDGEPTMHYDYMD